MVLVAILIGNYRAAGVYSGVFSALLRSRGAEDGKLLCPGVNGTLAGTAGVRVYSQLQSLATATHRPSGRRVLYVIGFQLIP